MEDDDIKKKLEEAGIKIGEWRSSPGGIAKSPILEKQANILRKIRDILEVQVQKDLATVGEMQEKLDRIEHGGGR